MSITSLNIFNLRNIVFANLDCSPQFNVFFGNNAAGKTSVLEAIYYLSTGKSFRTHHYDRIIQHDKTHLTLFAQLDTDIPTAVGLQRLRDAWPHNRRR